MVKFSVNLVKNQKALDIRAYVESHVRQMWNRLRKVNEYQLQMDFGIDPWKEEPTHSNYRAAADAIKSVGTSCIESPPRNYQLLSTIFFLFFQVYQQEPLYVCDGRSLPAVPILKEASYPCNMLVLSFRQVSHSPKLDKSVC